ncbi:hypothetical protein GCM10009107_27820 [Ideonella azotifigens]|uniref:N-acetyltransferase domain-containing protein n=2 Tax=Ideonella azotifigens TaxID=513160 RepID=A0ABN1K2L4_9BURK
MRLCFNPVGIGAEMVGMSMPAPVQLLGFRLRIAHTRQDLLAACSVRAGAYGRHLPQLQQSLLAPDDMDSDAHSSVLLCEEKRSGKPVGTMRLQHSLGGPLQIEHSVAMPAEVLACSRVELTRFAVSQGADPLVRLALMKAAFLHSRAAGVQLMLLGARSPALVRLYQRLQCSELFGAGASFPLQHAGGLPHRVLINDLRSVEARWRAAGHAWLGFMLDTWHPDIDVTRNPPASASADQALPLAA